MGLACLWNFCNCFSILSDSSYKGATLILISVISAIILIAAAAAFAGFLAYYRKNKLSNDSSNVVLLTGSGLKDLKVFNEILDIPAPIHPDLNELKGALS